LFVIIDSNIRIVTLNLAINLLKKLVFNEETQVCYLSEDHMSRIEQARQESIADLRRYYPVICLFSNKISKYSFDFSIKNFY